MKKLNMELSAVIINAMIDDMFLKDIIIQRPRAQGKTQVLKGILEQAKEWNQHQIENAKVYDPKKGLNKKDIETVIKMVNSSKPNLYDSYNGSALPPMPFILHNGKPWYDEAPPVDPEIFEMLKPKLTKKDFGQVMVFGTRGGVDNHWAKDVWENIDKDYSVFKPAQFIPEHIEKDRPLPILKNRRGEWLDPASNRALDEIAFFKKYLFEARYHPYTFEQRIKIYGYTI